jgi:peptidoglycan hydrolase CwlO-like protein
MTTKIDTIASEIDKAVAKFTLIKDEMDMSKKDIMFYTEEVTKRIKDGVNILAKQLEG